MNLDTSILFDNFQRSQQNKRQKSTESSYFQKGTVHCFVHHKVVTPTISSILKNIDNGKQFIALNIKYMMHTKVLF